MSPMVQILKAALDEALAAFIRGADDSAALMNRMLLCVIVQPSSSPGGAAGLTVADITFQLHEIEVTPCALSEHRLKTHCTGMVAG